VHDGDVGGSSAQEDDETNRGLAAAVAVESEEGLGFVIPHADGKAFRRFFDARVAEASERVDDALAHTVLARIKEQQVF